MRKKGTILFLSLLVAILFIFTNSIDVKAKQKEEAIFLHADYLTNYDEVDLLEEFDYSFIGEIDSYIFTSYFNGHGTDIPYTYFYVNVLETIKGEVEDKIIIKFYGGYDENNNLILLEGMTYPQKNEKYQFYCNKTNLSYDIDGRTINDSYVIAMKRNLEKIDNKLPKTNTTTNSKSINFINALNSHTTASFHEVIVIEDGGGYSNLSFATAYDLTLGESRSVYLAAGQERYYKITRSVLDYVSIYSTGSLDTMVYVYDSSYNLIGSNDDVSGTRALGFTSGRNFFYNFYLDKNTTYYFKVKFYSSSTSGTFTLNIIKDNWISSTNMSDLLWKYDGVDAGKKKVDYTVKSKYLSEINYGINEWNKLGTIKFQPDTNSTTNNIVISDYYDSEKDAAIAVTTYRWILAMTVKYNTYYFDNMTENQRIKTVLHEFGHVLGLDEFTGKESTNNVMHQGIRELTRLGPADIAAYRYKWG